MGHYDRFMSNHIELVGVQTNNLKNINIRIPLKKISVVTGVSGSGKSSLVFDTLYVESYRRYVESLSSYARQFLKAMPKPPIEDVKNLPPAIAVRQSRSGANNRSTVGTLTETMDLLRIIFAHSAKIYCKNCGKLVEKDTPESIGRKVLAHYGKNTAEDSKSRVVLLAPLSGYTDMNPKDLFRHLQSQGFVKLWNEQKTISIDDIDPGKITDYSVLIDRFDVLEANFTRMVEAASVGLKIGHGYVVFVDEKFRKLQFTKTLECCGVTYHEPSIELFSFNHPLGACQNCQGFGQASLLDWTKILPDDQKCLSEKGVAPWNFGQHEEMYDAAQKDLKKIYKSTALMTKPFAKYTPAEKKWLHEGSDTSETQFTGVIGYFKWLDANRYKAHYRIHASRFRKYEQCAVCHGERLNDISLACRIHSLNVAEVGRLTITDLKKWCETSLYDLESHQRDLALGLAEAREELDGRLNYLNKMGLSYLSLNRSAKTLSGGELQRINMSRCLGSALTDTLYCLDEPTSGLHARDSENILTVIRELRDQGNTIVTVEHERTIIKGADHVFEIGPRAGAHGGHVTFDGTYKSKNLAETKAISYAPPERKRDLTKRIQLSGAKTHNLKNISVEFPMSCVIGVCGVSGSGKTSLVQHTLYPALVSALKLDQVDRKNTNLSIYEQIGPAALLKKFHGAMLVSQAQIGRSSRSNIATYLGIFDTVRKIFSQTVEAKANQLLPGAFSFNTSGGRCETCKGLGTVAEDLSFLGEIHVICPSCGGKRFEQKVLDVTYKAKNLLEVLALTVDEARVFFYEQADIVSILETVIDLGLGYLTLGQSTSSFSGGEAQRLKMVELLDTSKKAAASFLIFDEPTTGLSDSDVKNLVLQLHKLADHGHAVIVVEHHLDLLKSCDWLIEIGPESAEHGGECLYEGPPDGLKEVALSQTARYLF